MRFTSRLRDCWRRDWISVDGGNEGQVIEINWRATRVRDRNGDTMVIPNSQIAKSRVTNHSLPERVTLAASTSISKRARQQTRWRRPSSRRFATQSMC